jgi:hypothetical protein
MGGFEVARISTETGSSRPLLTVTENDPESLDKITRRGPDTEIDPSWARTQPVVLAVASRDRTAFSLAK